MYRYWLEYLYFADICGFTPVISVGKDFAYSEQDQIDGTDNPFEYYFRQPGRITVNQAKVSRNVVNSDTFHKDIVSMVLTGKTSNYKYTKMYIYAMSRVVRKYIKYNDNTWNYIKDGLCQIGIKQYKVLGVHVRGTDFRGKYNNHPVYIEDNEIFEQISKIYDKTGYEKIFLATDDERILNSFKNKYGDDLCYYQDVVRSSKNRSVAFEKNERKHNQYKLGLEVIRDMYTLASCDGFIGGISQVAICAQINKAANRESYEDLIVIDKGIYHNSRCFRRN